jgi:hypothetical protein
VSGLIKVRVVPECLHEDGWADHGQAFEGKYLVVSHNGVYVDDEWVVERDRRMKSNREPGHSWLAHGKAWTGFRVTVETRS